MAIYEEWLLKAQRDLDTANALLEKPTTIQLYITLNNVQRKH